MIVIRGNTIGITQTMAALSRIGEPVAGAMEVGMGRAMAGGASIVRGRASGRPGPRNITGDYRRSIVGQHERVGEMIYGQVATNAAQGARLEFGFHGFDILGRFFNQPPYPHFGPSVAEIEKLAIQQISAEVRKAVG